MKKDTVKILEITSDIDNILPNLCLVDFKEIKNSSRSVLLKRSVITRNNRQHPDLTDKDKINALLSLYEYDYIFQDKRKTNYYHFVRKIETSIMLFC